MIDHAEFWDSATTRQDRPRPLESARCSLCDIELPKGLMMPDGGGACADVRWYCKDTRSCTERWTARADAASASGEGAEQREPVEAAARAHGEHGEAAERVPAEARAPADAAERPPNEAARPAKETAARPAKETAARPAKETAARPAKEAARAPADAAARVPAEAEPSAPSGGA